MHTQNPKFKQIETISNKQLRHQTDRAVLRAKQTCKSPFRINWFVFFAINHIQSLTWVSVSIGQSGPVDINQFAEVDSKPRRRITISVWAMSIKNSRIFVAIDRSFFLISFEGWTLPGWLLKGKVHWTNCQRIGWSRNNSKSWMQDWWKWIMKMTQLFVSSNCFFATLERSARIKPSMVQSASLANQWLLFLLLKLQYWYFRTLARNIGSFPSIRGFHGKLAGKLEFFDKMTHKTSSGRKT